MTGSRVRCQQNGQGRAYLILNCAKDLLSQRSTREVKVIGIVCSGFTKGGSDTGLSEMVSGRIARPVGLLRVMFAVLSDEESLKRVRRRERKRKIAGQTGYTI